MLSDYQDEPNGGNGWLRILTFDPITDKLYVRTYSPYLNAYQVDSNSQFALDYPTNGTNSFSIIVLPDTQYYSKSYPEIFKNQTLWIVENRFTFNIQFVVHLGDLVDQYNDANQWYRSKDAMTLLGDIPWIVVPGNHDFVTWEDNKHSYYYQFYGPHVFQNKPYYGGSWNDDNFNNFVTFDYDGNKFLILNLQNNPPIGAIEWAYDVVQTHPDRDVILITHEFVSNGFGRTAIGQMIWDALIKYKHEQIKIVLCGHFNGEARYSYEIIPSEHEVLLVSKV